MTKAPVDLQDLRRRLYVKAKAEPPWRFWGIYVHQAGNAEESLSLDKAQYFHILLVCESQILLAKAHRYVLLRGGQTIQERIKSFAGLTSGSGTLCRVCDQQGRFINGCKNDMRKR